MTAGVTLAETVRRVDGAANRDELVEALLRYVASRVAFAGLFVVSRGVARGWAAVGDADARSRFSRVRVTLDAASMFKTTVEKQVEFLAAPRGTLADLEFYGAIGRQVPKACLVVPIAVQKRVAMLVYADNGAREIPLALIPPLSILLERYAARLEGLLVEARAGAVGGATAAGSGAKLREPHASGSNVYAVDMAPTMRAATVTMGAAAESVPQEVPQEASQEVPLEVMLRGAQAGELAGEFAVELAGAKRPQSVELEIDVVVREPQPLGAHHVPLTRRYEDLPDLLAEEEPTRNDDSVPSVSSDAGVDSQPFLAEQRKPVTEDRVARHALAVFRSQSPMRHPSFQKLLGLGPDALPFLMQLFPGPIAVDPLAQDFFDKADVEDHGILLRLLVAIGDPAAPHLLRLLNDGNELQRRYAAFMFSKIEYEPAVPSLAEALFSQDTRLRMIAARVLSGVKGATAVAEVTRIVTGYAQSGDVEVRRVAAMAVGRLRLVGGIETLIGLLGDRDRGVVDAAHESLVTLSCRDFGTMAFRWSMWWKVARASDRKAWLVEALSDANESVRATAAAELFDLTGERFGVDAR